ncbi:tRNA-dihydrouridine(47) synthase [NAD(P)(+)]-like protein [Coemansia sp. RSA 552]|nr:tRNA-dihydrouridine(47) synthase [NAD(P)(+)]-like protein [Coemansia sp. RSA 552]
MAAEQLATAAEEQAKGYAPIKKEYLRAGGLTETPVTESGEKATGQNKNRGSRNRNKALKTKREDKLCMKICTGEECPFGDKCTFSHDVAAYLASKGPDLGPQCWVFDQVGRCDFGVRCRFAQAHTQDGQQVVDEEKAAEAGPLKDRMDNGVERGLQIALRKKQYKFPRTDEFDEQWRKDHPQEQKQQQQQQQQQAEDSNALDEVVKMEASRKRQRTRRGVVDYRGKTYLAPLTTVGNLPFRRVCKGFGVGITCSEMAVATNILQGQGSELALLKRHKCEDIFGVQLAGNRADCVGRAAEFISNECSVDFIDLNMGCPIDAAFNNGGGSALLAHPRKIERMVKTMLYSVDCDVTVKFRTGVNKGHNVAHSLVPQFSRWGAALGTLHGRTRQQRYTKHADWEYIGECHQLTDHMPLFGGGDVLSWEDYWAHMEERQQCDGIMVGRGALIKPWIFKEIEERRVWDISATERLDILKDFARFGMEHWGTDDQGINNVRRYLLEWQSFLHRYVPVGLLEVLPQRINDRPPPYFGRNDLETLMASPLAKDWIRISEMVLGPAPDDFVFVPKHKSNSYEG